MIGQIVSPFLGVANSAAPSSPAARPAVAEQPAAAAPADVVSTSSASEAATASATDGVKMSFAKRAGVGVMAGVALLGAGLLAPSAAQAQTFRGHYGHSQVYRQAPPVYRPAPVYRGGYNGGYRGGYNHGGRISPGAAFGLGVLGGIILGEALPPPVVYGPPVYGPPVVVSPGYNGYGCDGVYHHFDGFGNVTDASGHYRLIQNQWGQCMRVPAQPY